MFHIQIGKRNEENTGSRKRSTYEGLEVVKDWEYSSHQWRVWLWFGTNAAQPKTRLSLPFLLFFSMSEYTQGLSSGDGAMPSPAMGGTHVLAPLVLGLATWLTLAAKIWVEWTECGWKGQGIDSEQRTWDAVSCVSTHPPVLLPFTVKNVSQGTAGLRAVKGKTWLTFWSQRWWPEDPGERKCLAVSHWARRLFLCMEHWLIYTPMLAGEWMWGTEASGRLSFKIGSHTGDPRCDYCKTSSCWAWSWMVKGDPWWEGEVGKEWWKDTVR